MITKTYLGIYFKPKSGGLVCIYDPNNQVPRFWFFKSGDSINFISKNLDTLINHNGMSVHINDIQIRDTKQLSTYNQIIGMFAGMSNAKNITIKIVGKDRIQKRIMSLLDIKHKKDFKIKLRTKRMHSNQYNIVYELTNLMSRQRIHLYMWAYILAYYGFLKDKIKSYNHKEQKNGEETNRLRENDGRNPEGN